MEPCSNEVNRMEEELLQLMKELISKDPDAILRIENIFKRAKIERSVEKHCH